MLRNQINKLAKKNMHLKSGVECEYFLISPSGDSIADQKDIADKPCYDQSALMRQYDLIRGICDSMIMLGWGPYQNDHEDANGQFEMNWDFSDCLQTANKLLGIQRNLQSKLISQQKIELSYDLQDHS